MEPCDMFQKSEEKALESQMYQEVGELADYLPTCDYVTEITVSDSGKSLFLEVEVTEIKGTVSDMVRDFNIFGNGSSSNGNIKLTFEIEPYMFK